MDVKTIARETSEVMATRGKPLRKMLAKVNHLRCTFMGDQGLNLREDCSGADLKVVTSMGDHGLGLTLSCTFAGTV